MYSTNSRARTGKKFKKKKNINDMLRKERKCNHIKFSVKTIKDRKRVEDKNKNKE